MLDEYAEKMSRRSVPELMLYVHNRAEYREDAVLAALDELARRGEQPANAEAIRAELGPVVERQRQEMQAAAARQVAAEAVPVAEEAGPALYSPGTIVLFSVLFSFLAGGVLMVLNMFRLKEVGKAVRLVLFTLGFLVAASFALQWILGTYGSQLGTSSMVINLLGMAVNMLGVAAYLFYFWPRYVGPRPYVSRQWLPALLICTAFLLGLFKLAAPYLATLPK